ncbi:hypothetical protein IWQ49_006735 [Labrenzia sp. EL_126]|nr:hypothetical protein [Labrenzia sp. EL_126]
MTFTKTAHVLAVAVVFFGALYGALAFGLAQSDLTNDELLRYFPKGTGNAIDRALEMIWYGIVLGVLTEISRKLKS